MDILALVLTVLGLGLFEVITSIDNAIINVEVLSKMSQKARRWFLIWGMLIAVFLVRGLLPFVIFWMSNPSLSIMEVLTVALSSDPSMIGMIEKSAPILLALGGTFLLFLFFHWLFLEPKHFGLEAEKVIQKKGGVWFYAIVSIMLAVIVWYAIKVDPLMAFGAVIGSTAFFITHGFKENAERMEEQMIKGKTGMSDISKILYLEVIDATFSIDGVLGAFAFTLAVPLILIGNGIGAIVVRQITVHSVDRIRKYIYLKNGAMYSILALGVIMLLDSFGYHIPSWLSPAITFAIVGWFFYKSAKEIGVKVSP
jgi:uncharacterized protein